MHSCSWYSCWCVSLCHLCGVLLYGSVGGFCSLLHFIRTKEASHKPISFADPTTLYDEVSTNKKMKGDVMEMNTNTAYGSHVI